MNNIGIKYYKTTKVEFDKKINDQVTKEIEAFLNTDGGIIYLGVDDDGIGVGVDNLDETLRKVFDIITNQIYPSAKKLCQS